MVYRQTSTESQIMRRERVFKVAPSPHRLMAGLWLAMLLLVTSAAQSAPMLLSHFKMDGNGHDDLGNSPGMELFGTSFAGKKLVLPCDPEPGFYTALARISGFSYESFTVAWEFRVTQFDYPSTMLLSGGPSYRWIEFGCAATGHLQLKLNGAQTTIQKQFTNVLRTNQWHSLACAVDVSARSVVIFLDGQRLRDIDLGNFQFNVVGTPSEESDKAFSFWNYGNASFFCGQADNLRVYGRALAATEISSLDQATTNLFINELLFNPPFGDLTNEFVELRGVPNYVLPSGTYLVGVEGDAEHNPGTIQNRFDLSGRRIGQNGFLTLLQKFHRYKTIPYSTVLTNSDSGSGWGSGSSSSVGHEGEDDLPEIENPSATYFLIQSDIEPEIGTDIDANDDGTPDGTNFVSWTVIDSVGVLDSDGDGDIAYGKINFRRDTAPGNLATAGNTVVSVPFTPGYVARNGNTSGWNATNWVASDNLTGKPPNWFLGRNSTDLLIGSNTYPALRAKASLNHIGGPNFKAPLIPGVILRESGTNTLVSEAGLKDYYTLNLSLRATGAVTIEITAESPAQVSTDSGKTYDTTRSLVFTTTSPKKIMVRALDDGAAGPSRSFARITHSVSATLDERYSTDTIVLPVDVTITDTNVVLLSEAKINPPGEDAPYEFVELRGPAGKQLTNLYLVSIQGNTSDNPGHTDMVVALAGQRFGTNGLLIVAAPGHPYLFSPGTTVVLAPQLANSGGAFGNGSVSVLLIGSKESIPEGIDLDNGDNGTLEGLPNGAYIVDAIAWTDGSNNDEIYGGVDLTQRGFTPDAASRFPGSNAPRSSVSWYVGDLAGTSGGSLNYDSGNISTNSPPGSVMTPGVINKKPPNISPNPLIPLSGVIGDPENETVTFTVSDDDSPLASLTVTVTSTNRAVAPDANITLTNFATGKWRLAVEPVGVGYSEIAITVSDGVYSRRGFLSYAASTQGRLGAKWHSGVSDASTAIPIDANWMIVGDDENQILRFYSRTRSGGPAAAKDMNPFLNIVDFYDNGAPREVDIEGSTRVGNRIYWIGSHSHAFNALERTNRARLFATDISGTGTNSQLKVLAHYDFLKLDLVAWDTNGRHGKGENYYGLAASAAEGMDPKDRTGAGFNIEGLAMAPGPNNTTNVYIAFRAPLVPPTNRVNALVIPVLNFGKISTKRSGPGSAQFGAPIELNLGGRAVRSIEGSSGTNYLIVTGPPGAGTNLPPPGNFKLFTWSGHPTNQPIEYNANLTGLNPEGIVEVFPGPWSATNVFQIISDNGTNRFYDDGIEAKFLETREFKKFRVDPIALGDAVPSPPTLRFVAASGNNVTLNWFSTAGSTYRVQMKPGLASDWVDMSGDITASESSTAHTVAPPPDGQCFFRIIQVR